MHTGKASFVLEYHGPKIEKIEFSLDVEHIAAASVETVDDEDLSVELRLTEVTSYDEAEEIAANALQKIAGKLAFRLDAYVGGVSCSMLHLDGMKSLGKKTHSIAYSILQGYSDLEEKSRDDLKVVLEKPSAQQEGFCSLYRFALQQKDPVARFMFLYNILLQIFGDNQCRVDRFIGDRDGKADWEDSPHTKEPESPFTRLRNEVGHKREGVKPNFLKTGSEMKKLLKKLQEHVKTAILLKAR